MTPRSLKSMSEMVPKWLFIALAAAITFWFGLGAVNIILLIRERLH